MLAVSFLSYAASSARATGPEQAPSIPTYQWQFLSDSEKAAVNASLKAVTSQRIKNVALSIVDASGTPYMGTVRVTQDFTSFIYATGWASASLVSRGGNWTDYLALSPSRSYTNGGGPRWDLVEPVRGTFAFIILDSEWNSATEHGIVDFHLNIGASLRWIPAWAKNLDYDSLKSAIQEYDEALVSHFKGRVQYYELGWEANWNEKWPLEQIIGIIKTEALTIRAIDPSARICIDLMNISVDQLPFEGEGSNWTTEYFVLQLVAAGVPFDVIGLETHYGSGWAETAGGIDTLYYRLIYLSKFGKPLYIWEDGLGSYIDPGFLSHLESEPFWVGPWHGTPSEEKQAEYMVAETLVYLGNPSVLGVHWWALQDYPSDSFHMGVISYPDGSRKKSFYALEQLWNSLMVNETVQSIYGVATFRGLAGNYSISAEGYEVEPLVVHVSEGKQNTFSLVVRSLALRDQASQVLSKVGSNLTAAAGAIFQSSDAKNLLNQSLDEYRVAEQMFQSKDYAGALQHAQKALNLVREAYLKESEHTQEQQQQRQQQEQQQQQEQRQQERRQLLTRIVEIVAVVAVAGGCAVAALRAKKKAKRQSLDARIRAR